jgi:hypothetical protein
MELLNTFKTIITRSVEYFTQHIYNNNISVITFQLPTGGDLWSCYMDFETRRMDSWEKLVPSFKYNREMPFFEMLVPTVDTVRFGYLLEKLLAVRHSVLFTGGTGFGKVGHRGGGG